MGSVTQTILTVVEVVAAIALPEIVGPILAEELGADTVAALAEAAVAVN